MNVYMLRTEFSPQSVGAPEVVQQQVENKLRGALKGTELVNEFSRVSAPYKDGLMAVVCSEDAAAVLRAQQGLGIESLVLDEGRTARRHAAYVNGGYLPMTLRA